MLLSMFTAAVACGDDAPTNMSDPVCSSTDGRTACAGDFCTANTWCDAVLCNAGCQSSANCGFGERCDKSGTTVVGGAGVCRPCSTTPFDAGAQMDVRVATCDDVSGNYRLSLRAGNPPVCAMLPTPSSGISVTQDGSSATWTYADGDSVETLWTCSLDRSACRCDGTFTLQGVSGDVEWDVNAQTIEANAMGVICTFDASP